MPEPSRSAVALAYHEAGHAAVAVALGRSVVEVSITPGGPEQDGLCVHEHRSPEAFIDGLEIGDEQTILDAITVALAGDAAEVKAGFGDQLQEGEASDYTDAVDFAARLVTEDLDGDIERARIRAVAILDDPAVWRGVEELAAELLRAGTVSGADAMWILAATLTFAIEAAPADPDANADASGIQG